MNSKVVFLSTTPFVVKRLGKYKRFVKTPVRAIITHKKRKNRKTFSDTYRIWRTNRRSYTVRRKPHGKTYAGPAVIYTLRIEINLFNYTVVGSFHTRQVQLPRRGSNRVYGYYYYSAAPYATSSVSATDY